MNIDIAFRDPENGKITHKRFKYCDNLCVQKDRDHEVYDRAEDVSYFNFHVEFDCYDLQARENQRLKYDDVFSVDVI